MTLNVYIYVHTVKDEYDEQNGVDDQTDDNQHSQSSLAVSTTTTGTDRINMDLPLQDGWYVFQHRDPLWIICPINMSPQRSTLRIRLQDAQKGETEPIIPETIFRAVFQW